MSARGWERSVWDIKQSTREAVWSACEDKGPHAKRTCAEESTGVLANKNGPYVGGLGPHIMGNGPIQATKKVRTRRAEVRVR